MSPAPPVTNGASSTNGNNHYPSNGGAPSSDSTRPGPSPFPGNASRTTSSFRKRLSSAFAATKASLKSPPTAPDGLHPEQAKSPGDAPEPKLFLETLQEQILAGTIDEDVGTLFAALKEGSAGAVDDRKMLLERLVTMLGGLPANSTMGSTITNKLVSMLWDDLTHPPQNFVGPQSQYRSADGSGNNVANPTLGAAGTPYARSVCAVHPPPNNLPDASVVFDALLKRDKFTPHPSGISSLLFSFATLIIHSCFETNRTKPHINDTSSYLDLSPLYGNNKEQQATVRTFKNGEIHPDTIASSRLLFMPASVFALLLVFSRNHNFVVHKLQAINQDGRFTPKKSTDPKSADPDGSKKVDEDLFQTARLINCGYFMNVIFMDYIRVILNLNQTETNWVLNPTHEIPEFPNGFAARGEGNAVSVEFNILYRWHAAISEKDEKWIEALFRKYIGSEKSFDEMTEADFALALRELHKEIGPDNKTWTIDGLVRGPTGLFKDSDLVGILTSATDDVAGAFKARGAPACMRIIDMMGIRQARSEWSTCSLNEFRKFINLKPFTEFKQWNSDPEICKVAEKLYVHPDNLELFVGLHAEEAKPSREGSGLAPGYTISRAILSDAVALTRGDRYLTTDFSAGALTSWGYSDLVPDFASGAYGGVLGKLLMRVFPTSYSFNSIYAHFPFSTPATTRGSLTKFGKLDKYSFDTPRAAPAIKSVRTFKAVSEVLRDHKTFGVIYAKHISELTKTPYGFFISFDDFELHNRDRTIMTKALMPPGWEQGVRSFFDKKATELIKEASWTYNNGKTYTLDVVRDVTSMVAVHWVANWAGIPLKSAAMPKGPLFTPKELYGILSAFFIHVFMNFQPDAGFKLRDVALANAPAIHALIDLRISQSSGATLIVDNYIKKIQDALLGDEVQAISMGSTAKGFYQRLLESDRPHDELNASVQCTMTASVANQGEAAAHVINFYLDAANRKHYVELCRLSQLDTPEADKIIRAYIYEALRLDPQVPFVPRVAKQAATIQDGDRTVTVAAGDFMFPSVRNAGQDPSVYPNPTEVDITRDLSVFQGFGLGMHSCLGARIIDQSLVAMIKTVFRLKNVRRAPGQAGILKRVHTKLAETDVPVYITASSTFSPLPPSLSIVYDG